MSLSHAKLTFTDRVTILIGSLIFISAAAVGIVIYLQLNSIILKKEFRALTEKTAVKVLVLQQYFSEFSRDAPMHCTRQNLEHRIWLINMGFWSCNRVLQ